MARTAIRATGRGQAWSELRSLPELSMTVPNERKLGVIRPRPGGIDVNGGEGHVPLPVDGSHAESGAVDRDPGQHELVRFPCPVGALPERGGRLAGENEIAGEIAGLAAAFPAQPRVVA